MFTPGERTRLRDALVARARADGRIMGAALTGSASRGAEDRWSDIDLALGVAAGADTGRVMADWTEVMYREHGAVDHLDVVSGAVVYRVFLLVSTLQVDIAFAPEGEFGPTAPTFRLLFGRAADRMPADGTAADGTAADRGGGGRGGGGRGGFGGGGARGFAGWDGMAVCAARAVEPGPGAGVAGGVHDQRGT